MLCIEDFTSSTLIIPALFYFHFVQFYETLDLDFKLLKRQ